jgi:flagellar hook-associated protein 1 FlgK
MSLNGALHVGRSALVASQAAMQVAGNNMANAATEGYHRRSITLSPIRDEYASRGQYVGQGVQLLSIRREVDTALQARHRDALSEESALRMDQRFLTAIETLQNELTENDLSSLLSEFFNAFSEVANNPTDNATRAVAIQQGQSVANRVADMQRDYAEIRKQVDARVKTVVEEVNRILDDLETVNGQITQNEPVSGEAAALRDQRDRLIDELSEYMDVTVLHQDNGGTDILVDSVPVFLAGKSRGIELRRESREGAVELSIRIADDGTTLNVENGELGGLLRQREENIEPAIDVLNTFANQLIFQVNRLHSQGQGLEGYTSIAGTYSVADTTANLNAGAANLPHDIENGSFIINITHKDSGQRVSYQINVDGDAMSLEDLVNEINNVVGVSNMTAGVNAESQLTMIADAGYEISFSEDSSGALAALGVNTFFTGRGASSIAVREDLRNDPALLAVGLNHIAGSNDTALAIADLQDAALDDIDGKSLREFWQNSVNELAVKTSSANAAVASAVLIRESLSSQIQAVSGVSLDEESINLLTFQRQFQAASRYISVIDESLQVLLSLV